MPAYNGVLRLHNQLTGVQRRHIDSLVFTQNEQLRLLGRRGRYTSVGDVGDLEGSGWLPGNSTSPMGQACYVTELPISRTYTDNDDQTSCIATCDCDETSCSVKILVTLKRLVTKSLCCFF